jgi:transposase
METYYFLGIDISKKKIDAALTIDGKNFHEVIVENQLKSIQEFFKQLKSQISSLDKLIICMEHTGIYGQHLLDVAVDKHLHICVEPGIQIKQSQGMTRGKNDKVDAKRIAVYAFKNRESLSFWTPQRECVQELKALLVNRERLVRAKVALEVPIKESGDFIHASIRKRMISFNKGSIKALEKDIEKIEQAIQKLVKADTQLSEKCDLATSVPGIGKIVAWNMLVSSGEFNKISEAKKFACYAGVAPFQHQSGSSIRGKTRVSKMANMTLKRLLHLAALTAIQHNQELKAFYQRKVEAGKNKMSVVNAVRNKLISRVYACINQQRPYQKNYQYALV